MDSLTTIQEKHTAGDKVVAFDYQFYYFMCLALDLRHGDKVGFEVKDDVHIDLVLRQRGQRRTETGHQRHLGEVVNGLIGLAEEGQRTLFLAGGIFRRNSQILLHLFPIL